MLCDDRWRLKDLVDDQHSNRVTLFQAKTSLDRHLHFFFIISAVSNQKWEEGRGAFTRQSSGPLQGSLLYSQHILFYRILLLSLFTHTDKYLTERRNSRLFTICSLRSELSPSCMPQVARVQSCANHMQHIGRSSCATCVPRAKGQLS